MIEDDLKGMTQECNNTKKKAKEVYSEYEKIYNQYTVLELKHNELIDDNKKLEGELMKMRNKEEKKKN